jgi:hypothetical protein
VSAGFDELSARWGASPIRHCPGRFVLTRAPASLSPAGLLGADARLDAFTVPAARDTVIVAELCDGGVISYQRADGTYLHTLNTPDGFRRKLTQLGIRPNGQPAAGMR